MYIRREKMKKATFKLLDAQHPDDMLFYSYLKEALASLGADWAIQVKITEDGREYSVVMEEDDG